eukprot:TRINITY_DN28855_c0_g1_i1.p1 TRINITY_DN28855_c0_g1~~TRINITY_DN28855_c0_g1_i1.p1  ORF type:complete len:232 (+),score=64.64 TRINITY_DN28855_c0_g1_i1:48-743(+)
MGVFGSPGEAAAAGGLGALVASLLFLVLQLLQRAKAARRGCHRCLAQQRQSAVGAPAFPEWDTTWTARGDTQPSASVRSSPPGGLWQPSALLSPESVASASQRTRDPSVREHALPDTFDEFIALHPDVQSAVNLEENAAESETLRMYRAAWDQDKRAVYEYLTAHGFCTKERQGGPIREGDPVEAEVDGVRVEAVVVSIGKGYFTLQVAESGDVFTVQSAQVRPQSCATLG